MVHPTTHPTTLTTHILWPPTVDPATKQTLRQMTRQQMFDTALDLVTTTAGAIHPVEYEDAAVYMLTVYVYWHTDPPRAVDPPPSYLDTSGSSTLPVATTT